MNNCTVCDGCFQNDHRNKIICDGICRQPFHAECANFSKDALLCYREMPNLQWFCDGCIIQTRLSNVSSRQFDNFNSTAIIPTSSPSYAQCTLIAAKSKRKRNRNRNHNPIPDARSNKASSVLLVTRSANVEHDVTKANDSMSSSSLGSEMQPKKGLVTSPSVYGEKPPTTSIQCNVALPTTQHNTAGSKLTLEEPSELTTRPAGSSSSGGVLTESSISARDSVYSRSIVSPSETHKVAYVSNFHPSVNAIQVINYLCMKKVISSSKEVSCKKLVSPDVDIDSVSFVSFRITADSKIFHSIVNSNIWPNGIVAREFLKR